MSSFDETKKYVEKNGGCQDWPCDYACLRRGTCLHLREKVLGKKDGQT